MTAPILFADLAFRGWFPWWAAVPLGLIAAAGVVYAYVREFSRRPLLFRIGLAAVRTAFFALLLFLALKPTLVTDTHGTRPRPVGLLIDDSQSMGVTDPRPTLADQWRVAVAFDKYAPGQPLPDQSTALPADLPHDPPRLAVAKAALANPKLDLLGKLKAIGPIQASSFGSSRGGLDVAAPKWADALQGSQPRTAMADAAFDLLNRDANELPAAVVLVTDGRENASGRSLDDLARECKRAGVPLHVYGVGSSAFGQLHIRDVAAAETLFVEDIAVVPVRYRAKGLTGGKVEFTLKLGNTVVDTKTVEAKTGDDLREQLKFVPGKADAQAAGKQELTVRATYTGEGETVTDQLSRAVKIIDKKMKVLVIDSQPRWDFKYIQRGLMRDRRVQAKFILTDGDPAAMRSGDPFLPAFPADRPDLFAYDLLILGDMPASFLTRQQQEWVREFVAEGGGLIQVAGRGYGPATFAGTPLADPLPVEFEPVKVKMDPDARTEPFRPRLTAVGERSPLVRLDDAAEANKKLWSELRPMYWHYPVTKAKPAAEVLIAHPTDKTADGQPRPLLVTHYYGKGFVVFAGFEETWRWRYNEADKIFYRFWSQAFYAAGVSRTLGTKLTQLSLDNPDPTTGQTGQIYARLLSPDLKPRATGPIEAKLERLDVDATDKDRTVPVVLKPLPSQPGEYVATVPFNAAGRFALKVENSGDTASLEYRVALRSEDELAPGGMAEEQLRQLAEATGGKFYREEDLHTLGQSIEPKTVPFDQHQEIDLWNKWMLIALVLLLAAEWVGRKLGGMS